MDTLNQILVVDDDSTIRDVLRIQLENNGYSVLEAANGRIAIEAVRNNKSINLIILDIMMPELSGIDTCGKIRKLTLAPILFLTARFAESDKAEAYGIGGDDYLVKPFSQGELLMKVQSLLRRYTVYRGENEDKEDLSKLQIKDIVIDKDSHRVTRENKDINLTDTEFEILMFLDKNRGIPKDVKAIYEGIWGESFLPSSANTIMVHILNLRKKLEVNINNPTIIRTVWGKGYQIDE